MIFTIALIYFFGLNEVAQARSIEPELKDESQEYIGQLEEEITPYQKVLLSIVYNDIKNEKGNSFSLYDLRNAIQKNISENSLFYSQAYSLLDKINEDIQEYESELKAIQDEKEKLELEEFRANEIEWTKHFANMFMSGKHTWESWNKISNSIKNINIYNYFKDGKYCAPVKNPDYQRVLRNYEKDHYSIDISVAFEEELFSVANNAIAEVNDNSVILHLETNTDIVYLNINPLIKTGDIVNKGDVIGVSNNEFFSFAMLLREKEISPVWIMSSTPFITESGMSMPLFIQYDPIWNSMNYGTGLIGKGGCGPSALSMAISYLNDTIITPAHIVKTMGGRYYIKDAGSTYSLINDTASTYNLNCKRISATDIITELEKGNPVIGCMGPGEFTDGGHFITLSGITSDGKILVNDSADNIYAQHYNKEYSINLIASQGNAFWSLSKK